MLFKPTGENWKKAYASLNVIRSAAKHHLEIMSRLTDYKKLVPKLVGMQGCARSQLAKRATLVLSDLYSIVLIKRQLVPSVGILVHGTLR